MDIQTFTEHMTRSRWYFYETRPGLWQWDLVGETGELVRQSERAFESRGACVTDAKAHGYGARV